ncbi:MAG: endonuclease/exonuclease/phosphatase family protein [Bdellovibrionales bacterium]
MALRLMIGSALSIFFVSIVSVQTCAKSKTITLMSYNVENLFDWTHDEGKLDYTYMPLQVKLDSPEVLQYCRSQKNPHWRRECLQMDWTERLVEKKAANLADMIRAGVRKGPDIIVLSEVENINVLNLLLDWEFKDSGYNTVELIEGPDKRGIDVAVISKYPLAKPSVLHKINLSSGKKGKTRPTRGILEVQLKIGKNTVAVFSNHWPSQANPSQHRYKAAQVMMAAAKKVDTKYIISAGDFNTVKKDNPHGLNELVLNDDKSFHFYDLSTLVPVQSDSNVNGSHWYRGKWSFLDKIMVSNKSLNGKNPMDISYLRVVSPSFSLIMDNRHGSLRPMRFKPSDASGYSDHLPLLIEFSIN